MRPARFCLNPDGSRILDLYGKYEFKVYKDDMLVLEEGDLWRYIGHLLKKYYDASVNSPDHASDFDPYDDNLYPISSILKMVDELSADLLELENDISSPKSKVILDRTLRHRSDEEIRDFYRRFIPRLRKLVTVSEEYDIFVFFGN